MKDRERFGKMSFAKSVALGQINSPPRSANPPKKVRPPRLAPRKVRRAQARAAKKFFEPVYQKRGTLFTNRAAIRKTVHELKMQRREFRTGTWVVELGKAIRSYVNGRGPGGLDGRRIRQVHNRWTFNAWPTAAPVKTFHDRGYLPGTADMLRITAAQHRRERRAQRPQNRQLLA